MEVHLLFSNDTHILCDATEEHIDYLNWAFMWF